MYVLDNVEGPGDDVGWGRVRGGAAAACRCWAGLKEGRRGRGAKALRVKLLCQVCKKYKSMDELL